ncbi:BnaC09g13150D [Brassica napus]|uniref:BnaC09g13150D protein n=1 Tax=Brassica napus TaxID=3708 RepID=A0A078H340_BRANA|nr:BnaC09g13150D [Brassica napus]
MAISHVHPMFLLVLSLFFLPILLAQTAFITNCSPVFGGIRATGLETFVEQGRKSFNLTCSTDTVLTKGVIIAVVKRGYTLGPILNVQRYNLCDLITCPVAPGSFVITFRKLYPVGIKWHIETKIIVNGVPVPADGSLCVDIDDYYFP